MRIGERTIDVRERAYLIAEIGVNHDGDVDRALELVDACAEAGADAVKTQCFGAERLLSRASRLADYQRRAGEVDPVEMLRRLELSRDALAAFVDRAHKRGIHAIVTPFSVVDADAMAGLGWDAFKTASPDVIHRPLLNRLARDGRPVIVSTGAATVDEVLRAAGWLTTARDRLAFLHCVSSYPAPRASLGGVRALYDALGIAGCGDDAGRAAAVGYSDHTPSPATIAEAAWIGARIIEKHVTLDRSLPGPDHGASITPDELASAVAQLRREARTDLPTLAEVRERMPDVERFEKNVLPEEMDVRHVSRQSIVATRVIEAGDVLTPACVAVKRPGTGVPPYLMDAVMGRRVTRRVEADTPIGLDDVEGLHADARTDAA